MISSPVLLALLTAAAVVAVPDVHVPLEPNYNTGGNQCYDEHGSPQVILFYC